MERITRKMLENQFAWWVKNHPAGDPDHHWMLDKYVPNGTAYWGIHYGRKDHKGGVSNGLVTAARHTTRTMFDCLYFANQSHLVEERTAPARHHIEGDSGIANTRKQQPE